MYHVIEGRDRGRSTSPYTYIHVPREVRGVDVAEKFLRLRMQLREPGGRTSEGFTYAGYGLSSDGTRCSTTSWMIIYVVDVVIGNRNTNRGLKF
jgi:hypothetical protein